MPANFDIIHIVRTFYPRHLVPIERKKMTIRYNVSLFSDEATLDNNLASYAWSLFPVKRHEVRASCLIMPEVPQEEKQ